MRSHLAAAAALGIFATQSFAQHFSEFCPSPDICYNLNIPASTASSGTGDIYFQISGPTSYTWIGLGQGSGMVGANIFVIYQDGNGNVTLSPRLGVGHVEPEHDTAAKVTLLEGSGVAGGKMVANVRCENCESWPNGEGMDFTSNSGGWLFASHEGEPLDSTDPDAEIEQHQAHGTFVWDFTAAKGGADVNPFVKNSGEAVSSVPKSSSSGGGEVESESEGEDEPSEMMVTAHGVLASIAFLVLLPSGAIFIRVPALSRIGGVWMHAAIQIFGYGTFIAAAGLGIYIATETNYLMRAHPIIGMVLLGVLFTQPFAGLAHHYFFKKSKGRTLISYEHIFVGRGAILLGMINGGLGLKLAGVTNMGYLAAYGVVAGVMGSAYLVAIVFGEVKRSKSQPQDEERKESR